MSYTLTTNIKTSRPNIPTTSGKSLRNHPNGYTPETWEQRKSVLNETHSEPESEPEDPLAKEIQQAAAESFAYLEIEP